MSSEIERETAHPSVVPLIDCQDTMDYVFFVMPIENNSTSAALKTYAARLLRGGELVRASSSTNTYSGIGRPNIYPWT